MTFLIVVTEKFSKIVIIDIELLLRHKTTIKQKKKLLRYYHITNIM